MASLEEEIVAIEALRAKALIDADAAMLNVITDNDYVHVEANGLLRDKATFLEAIEAQGVRFYQYDLVDNRIRIFGDVAVVTGSFENTMGKIDGRRHSKRGRHCRVYIRRPEGWKNILHQGTEKIDVPDIQKT